MSDTHQYPNLPQATWSCWGTNMVPYLQSQGCTNIQFSGGNSGTLSFQHSFLFSHITIALDYAYDPASQTLTLTVTQKPVIVSSDQIFSRVQDQIYTCPPQ